MTEENQRLRERLHAVEGIATAALNNQPSGDEACAAHLQKAADEIRAVFGPADRQGNAAVMREALERCRNVLIGVRGYTDDPDIRQGVANALSEDVNPALIAPPRNCDRFRTEQAAQLAFLNEVWLIYVTKDTLLPSDAYNSWTDKMKEKYSAWLFTPATIAGEAGEGGAE